MKASVVTLSEVDIPSQMFAVLLRDPASAEDGSVMAMFTFGDHATQWGNANYAGRFTVVEVRL